MERHEFSLDQIRGKTKKNQCQMGTGKRKFRRFSSEHHPAAHHKKMRPINLYIEGKSPSSLKGCVKLMTEDTVTQSKPNIVTVTAILTHQIRFRKNSTITTPDSTP